MTLLPVQVRERKLAADPHSFLTLQIAVITPYRSGAFGPFFLQEIAKVAARAGMAVQWLRANADTWYVAPGAIAITG